jgi:hypothetical protein
MTFCEVVIMLNDDKFMFKYNIAKKYYETYGNLLIPTEFIIDGVDIGRWIKSLRNSRNCSNGITLTEERIKLLDDIGMIWRYYDYQWYSKYYLLKDMMTLVKIEMF